MKHLIFISLLLLFIHSNAQESKSYKLIFYAININTEEYVDYEKVTAANKQTIDTASFVCEIVNVFDPDIRYVVSKFAIKIKSKDGEQSFIGLSEAALLEKIVQTNSNSDGSPSAVITVTKVSYKDFRNTEDSSTDKNFDYNTITVY
ncbi:MAG: hypothetical protein IPO21_00690 [Bacteroidales bacterium]|nr:hypothetical protein [Bacteroidales bacterium]